MKGDGTGKTENEPTQILGRPLQVKLLPWAIVLSTWLPAAAKYLPKFRIVEKEGWALLVVFREECPFKPGHPHGAYLGQRETGEIVAGCFAPSRHPRAWGWYDLLKHVRRKEESDGALSKSRKVGPV